MVANPVENKQPIIWGLSLQVILGNWYGGRKLSPMWWAFCVSFINFNYKNMFIELITLGFIVGTAFLIKEAKNKKTTESYVFVLLGGIVTFFFGPLIRTLLIKETIDYGAISTGIQMASTIFGIYFIVWSIIKIVKNKKI